MIRLCDWCCLPFPLFVSILINTRWGKVKELRRDSQNGKLPRLFLIIDVGTGLDVE